MKTQSLLIELGTEELPPKALPALAQAFAAGIAQGLAKRGIGFATDSIEALYTPRRLAVRCHAVQTEQGAQRSEVFGPYANIALDSSGEPTQALQRCSSQCPQHRITGYTTQLKKPERGID